MALTGTRSDPYRPKNPRIKKFIYDFSAGLQKHMTLWNIIHIIWLFHNYIITQFRSTTAIWLGRVRGYYPSTFDVDRVVWINPEDVRYTSLLEFPTHEYKGRVVPGRWDLLEKRFDSLDLYNAFRQVFCEGRAWSETAYYQWLLTRIEQGYVPRGCKNRQDIDRRCKWFETLYNSIRTNGYRTVYEQSIENRKTGFMRADVDEVGINISRYGDLLFSDGAHRLCMAKVLGLEKMPVKIVVRHPHWTEIRKELLHYSQKTGRRLPPLIHPDLTDISHDEEAERLFELIESQLPATSGKLLDVDSGLGYFCHRFEARGFDCYALESSPRELIFLTQLRRASNRNFKIIDGNDRESHTLHGMKFDVILMLGYYFHPQTGSDWKVGLARCLDRFDFNQLFILVPPVQQSATSGSSLEDNTSELVRLLKLKNPEGQVQELAQTWDGCTLYLLVNPV